MNYLKTFVVGLAMGACDIVPGISGGTIAFISGIYQKLLSSIHLCLNIDTLKLVLQGKIGQAWSKVDGFFLLSIFGGILISVVLLSSLLEGLLVSHPQLIWGFFAGLIVASILLLLKQQKIRGTREVFALIIGGLFAWAVTQLTPTQVIPHWWVIIGSAMIAISAMILPGLSGSFLLLIMGMYGHVIGAISEGDLVFLGLFVVGIILGLASFVRVVSWAFNRYYSTTIAVLIGFMIGALPKLWPRQNALKTTIDRHGEEIVLQSKNVLPGLYAGDSLFFWVIGLFLIGCFGSYIIFSTIDQDVYI